ncbi:hypothetical protein K2Z83_11765 [Oscillochloris sp. ZM17-4]|uniref:hypothetical protein n=1 Tax=Oscillochloris sp. ZM17-4 TaxID=2866714 RepID=UPI001C730A56|nr:hypothetical protein [Oscillochloris sp. ZM17-4]MBX0328353.1 hypothetical protein [Oscillochloris sp. ZM17-4]
MRVVTAAPSGSQQPYDTWERWVAGCLYDHLPALLAMRANHVAKDAPHALVMGYEVQPCGCRRWEGSVVTLSEVTALALTPAMHEALADIIAICNPAHALPILVGDRQGRKLPDRFLCLYLLNPQNPDISAAEIPPPEIVFSFR